MKRNFIGYGKEKPKLFWPDGNKLAISIVVNIGMWFERFVIIVTSLHRDYLPSSWTMFSPTFVEISIFKGTIWFFIVLFL